MVATASHLGLKAQSAHSINWCGNDNSRWDFVTVYTPPTVKRDDYEIHGIQIPPEVLRDLKHEIDCNPHALSSGEIQDILIAREVTGQIVNDPEGINLRDRTRITEQEKQEDRERIEKEGKTPGRSRRRNHGDNWFFDKDKKFTEKLEAEREKKLKERCCEPHKTEALVH